MDWPVESIPDTDGLFFRVHVNDTDGNGHPIPGAFRNSPKTDPHPGMSVNWDRYSDAEGARQGASKPPSHYAVVRLIAGRVREIRGQTVTHEPFLKTGRTAR